MAQKERKRKELKLMPAFSSSLLKISFALAIISLYTYVFALVDVVDGGGHAQETQSLQNSNAGEGTTAVPHEPGDSSVSSGGITPASSATLNVVNSKIPGLADYGVPVIPKATTAANFADPNGTGSA
ncbi:MAG: hypothetical protein FWG83_07335, partial [Oscillospiraceae bacterium]|nr:hypothetical protein [Oscillospiraceae bacterium]